MVILSTHKEEALNLAEDLCIGLNGCHTEVWEDLCPYCRLSVVIEEQSDRIEYMNRLLTAARIRDAPGVCQELYEEDLAGWADRNRARMEMAENEEDDQDDADNDEY